MILGSGLARVEEVAHNYMLIPRVEGGRSWDGCDCEGWVWMVYQEELGITLPYPPDPKRPDLRQQLIDLTFQPWHRVYVMRAYDVVVMNYRGWQQHLGLCEREGVVLHMSHGGMRRDYLMDERFERSVLAVHRHPAMLDRHLPALRHSGWDGP